MATRSRVQDPWLPAENLGAGINSDEYDGGPTLSADGLTLLFNSDRKGLGSLWQCSRESIDRPWSLPKSLGEPVNSRAFQGWATLANDGLALIFNSNRSGGPMAGPLWIARRSSTGESWSVPIRLHPEGSKSAWSPCLSADATMLLFDSKRLGGYGDFDIWMMRRVMRREPSRASLRVSPDPLTADQ
jgi:Tol biopolymer transport system component